MKLFYFFQIGFWITLGLMCVFIVLFLIFRRWYYQEKNFIKLMSIGLFSYHHKEIVRLLEIGKNQKLKDLYKFGILQRYLTGVYNERLHSTKDFLSFIEELTYLINNGGLMISNFTPWADELLKAEVKNFLLATNFFSDFIQGNKDISKMVLVLEKLDPHRWCAMFPNGEAEKLAYQVNKNIELEAENTDSSVILGILLDKMQGGYFFSEEGKAFYRDFEKIQKMIKEKIEEVKNGKLASAGINAGMTELT